MHAKFLELWRSRKASCLPRRTGSRVWKKYMQCHAHSSLQVAASECPWAHDRINDELLFNLKKEEKSNTSYNMDQPCGYYAKCDKLVTKGQILCDCAYISN